MGNKGGEHIREYGGLFEIPEKAALKWLVKRMPRWINSDHLSILGLISMVAAGASFWMASRNRWALIFVILSLALNWFGDSLDGTLARYRNCQRPRYGYYVDHVIDLLGIAALFTGVALSGFMNHAIALALLAVYSLVEAEVFLAVHVRQIFRLSCFGIGPTELRIVLSIGALRLLYKPTVVIAGRGPFMLFDVGGLIAIAGLMIAFLYSAIRNTRELYRLEPLAKANQSGTA
jgi:archaetidylinositol phosphate synthase